MAMLILVGLTSFVFKGLSQTQESRTLQLNNDSITVGLDKLWGGAIREIYLNQNGRNLINTFDAGRLMGVSIYDGALTYPQNPADPSWGWNAVPGDKYGDLNAPLAIRQTNNQLYVKSGLIQWNPAIVRPEPADLAWEQWLSFLPDFPRAFKITYRLTHGGLDAHAARQQELPYIYAVKDLNTLVTYSGSAPWQNNAATKIDIARQPIGLPLKRIVSAERWAGLVDSAGVGLTLWAPSADPAFQYTFHDGPGDYAASYLIPALETGFPPDSVCEAMVYVFVGHWQAARAAIYQLNQQGLSKPEPKFIQALGSPHVYEIMGHLKHWLPTPAILAEIKPAKAPIIQVLPEELNAYHRARLLQKQGTNKLYYLTDSGFTRPMANTPAVIASYGNVPADIIAVSAAELAAYPWVNLVRAEGDARAWLIKGGRKHLIQRPAALARLKLNSQRIAPINQIELNTWPTGAAIR